MGGEGAAPTYGWLALGRCRPYRWAPPWVDATMGGTAPREHCAHGCSARRRHPRGWAPLWVAPLRAEPPSCGRCATRRSRPCEQVAPASAILARCVRRRHRSCKRCAHRFYPRVGHLRAASPLPVVGHRLAASIAPAHVLALCCLPTATTATAARTQVATSYHMRG